MGQGAAAAIEEQKGTEDPAESILESSETRCCRDQQGRAESLTAVRADVARALQEEDEQFFPYVHSFRHFPNFLRRAYVAFITRKQSYY